MRVFLSVAIAAAALSSVSANDDDQRLNGWYSCGFSLEKEGLPAEMNSLFECAEIQVPLCYDGVCESDKMISLFVKRFLTKSTDPSIKRKAMIAIQGGPGAASPVMEDTILSMIGAGLTEAIDFYTFDHRGTGRTEFLNCEAAQALAPGSPDGIAPSLNELPACFEDLIYQYDGQAAAFSTTSAAMDVRTMIETFMAEHDVFVAGYSYGTYLTQRLLQLSIPQIKGYIFDSVDILTTNDDPFSGDNSHWNQAIQKSGRRLLEFCFDDPECPIKFKSRETVVEDVLAFLAKFDEEKDTNACAKIFYNGTDSEPPSVTLRGVIAGLAGDSTKRVTALAILGAVQKCGDEDVQFLEAYMASQSGEKPSEPVILDPIGGDSLLLKLDIVNSERYHQPAPMKAERDKFFNDGVFSMPLEDFALAYYVFTGSTEPACEEVKDQLPQSNETFFYQRDKYYNVPLELPSHAGALVISGGLDFATPQEFSELLYSKLNGTGQGVMYVNFDYGTHCGGESIDAGPAPCHDAIIAQFIMNDADVTKVDVNCMEKLPVPVFHMTEEGSSSSSSQLE